MPSLQPTYLAQLTFGTAGLAAIHRLGEARGRQDLFLRQYPEQLKSLRTHAQVESTESSNRIEGIVASPGRVRDLVVSHAPPRDRSEQEIAGYRDALQLIHESHADMPFTENVVLQLHQMLYRYQPGSGGRWKSTASITSTIASAATSASNASSRSRARLTTKHSSAVRAAGTLTPMTRTPGSSTSGAC